MDGGCQVPEIAYRSKLVMKNMVRSIGIQSIMKPKTVCQYFTGNDRITASTTNVYLRYLTSFLLFLHEEYPKIFRFEGLARWHTMQARQTCLASLSIFAQKKFRFKASMVPTTPKCASLCTFSNTLA